MSESHWGRPVRLPTAAPRSWSDYRCLRPSAPHVAALRPTNGRPIPTGRNLDRGRSEKLARLEAALFVADGPLTSRKLAQHALLADTKEANALIDELNAAFDADSSAFVVERVAAGFQLMTRPEFATWLDRLHSRTERMQLSGPAMEVLTIVAYRQPITRADIESIRGSQCADMLKQLMERKLVKVGGQEDTLGRPYLYDTTREFLAEFGLRNLSQLPDADAMRKPASGGVDEPGDTNDGESGAASDEEE
ncbi:SMC-Scp complex subunit ScpB [Stratiformator vulcanicus]|uniref:Segregation and condensation protein B n=1 Tax=Stratiformator vulcanicus TaxID=2527980 RepID=A0A517R3H2_9PLAN|nr:SMC-Scp complex subunit ScpB [Stratiformator vulcanicus]QDT38445.1 hypothetical protein Pan189_28390 [Stratiformator vulcanicus]